MSKRYFTALLLSLAVFSAGAIAPLIPVIWLFSGAATYSLYSALNGDYIARDVKATTSSPPVRVHVKIRSTATEDASALSAPSGYSSPAVPQQVTRSVFNGSTSVTIPSQTGYAGGTLSGTLDQVVSSLRYASQPPFQYSSSLTNPRAIPSGLMATSTATVTVTRRYGSYKPTYGASSCFDLACASPLVFYYYNSPNSFGGSTATGFFATVDVNYGNGTTQRLVLPLEDASFSQCGSGYSVNPADPTKCDLTSLSEARADSGTLADGKCVVSRGVPNPFDVDCSALRSAGSLVTENASDGTPVLKVVNTGGSVSDSMTIAVHPKPDGSQQLTTSEKGADGSGSMFTASIDPDGKVGPVTGTIYPAQPAPQYPGQAGSGTPSGSTTSSGSGSGSGGGSTCGGPNQPACSMTPADGFWDGLKETLGIGDGDPELPDVTTDIPCEDCDSNQQKRDSFFSSVLDFNSFTLNIPDVSCRDMTASYDTSFSLFSEDFSVSFTPVCDLMDAQESIIRSLFLLGWTLLAVFILISKVE